MITDADRQALAALALRALDRVEAEYGGDATLICATLVYEVRVDDPDGDDAEALHHTDFSAYGCTSPFHVGGLLSSTGDALLRPEPPE